MQKPRKAKERATHSPSAVEYMVAIVYEFMFFHSMEDSENKEEDIEP
jgi:hypothetical protein